MFYKSLVTDKCRYNVSNIFFYSFTTEKLVLKIEIHQYMGTPVSLYHD